MELYQRKRGGAWYVDLVDPTTKERVRKSTRKTVKREAEQVARRLLSDVEAADGKRPITIREALDGYVASLAALGKASAAGAGSLRDKSLGLRPGTTAILDGDRPLHSICPADLENLVTTRLSEGVSPQTVAHELKNLRAATKRAVGLRYRGPDLESWRLPKVALKLRYLTPDEFWQVYNHLDPMRPVEAKTKFGKPASSYIPAGKRLVQRRDVRDLFVVLGMTGMRWGEVAAMTWEQVDLGAKVIRVWGNKTEQERVVGIPEPLEAVLRARAASRTGPRVFPGADPDERRSGSCRPIIRAMDAVGLNRPDLVARYGRATVHSLRHTFASLALQNGATLADVQQALGHTTLQMTRRYAHLEATPTAAKLAGLVGTALGSRSEPGQRFAQCASTARENDTSERQSERGLDKTLSATVVQMPVRRRVS